MDVRHAVGVALDGDGERRGRGWEMEAVELRERCLHRMASPEAGSEEDGGEQQEDGGGRGMEMTLGRMEGRGASEPIGASRGLSPGVRKDSGDLGRRGVIAMEKV